MKRYYLLIVAALAVAMAALGGHALLGSGLRVAAAPGAAPSAQYPGTTMAPLPEATCALVDATRTCELWALPGMLALPDGSSVNIWGFASSAAGPALSPGPAIRAQAGETLEIVLHNEIPGETVSMSFPGHEGLVPDMDGVPQGGTAIYTIPLDNPGTFLYEAGMTPGGSRQVAMGMAGPLVVEPSVPSWDQELVLVFSEVDPYFNQDPYGFLMNQFRPSYWLINGSAFPDTGAAPVAPGATILMRYLNISANHLSVGVLGLNQEILAMDGEMLPFSRGAMTQPLAPGQGVDALVRVPATAVTGTLYPLYNTSLHQHNNNQRASDGRSAFGGMLAFLEVTDGGTPAGLGPVASNVTVVPQKTNGTADVLFSADLTDDDSDVVGYEYFVDSAGAPGTGNAGAIGPAASVHVEIAIPAATLESWTSGQHTLYIRGQDALGNWGALGSAVLNLDKAGPVIGEIQMKPHPTNGTQDVMLKASADDRQTGGSVVVAGEYRLDGGAWQPMTLNITGSTYAGLVATIPAATVAALGEGEHVVEVQAQDDLGNWSVATGSAVLQMDATGPDVPQVTVSPNTLDFNQPITATSVRLTATIEDPLSGGIQSRLVNAEGFIDVQGTPGTGFALFPSDGLFDEPAEDVHYNMPLGHFSTLDSGEHQILVVGKDAAGNWGPAGSATLTVETQVIDTTGPFITDLVADPNPTDGAPWLTLTARATDTDLLSNVAAAEWFEGADPGAGAGTPMLATDGAFDSPSEDVEAEIRVNRWSLGTHQVWVRGRDASGNWGEPAMVSVEVTRRLKGG